MENSDRDSSHSKDALIWQAASSVPSHQCAQNCSRHCYGILGLARLAMEEGKVLEDITLRPLGQ